MSSSQSEKKEEVQPPTLHQFVSTNIGTFSKLLFFMAALATFPIMTYFGTVDKVFEGERQKKKRVFISKHSFYLLGNSTYAGGAAAVVANVVVIAYIVVAIYEDKASPEETKKNK
jgi:D-alanyl-lipoteichoic acid acyltransferase DltB (MBOAT superfamily)